MQLENKELVENITVEEEVIYPFQFSLDLDCCEIFVIKWEKVSNHSFLLSQASVTRLEEAE